MEDAGRFQNRAARAALEKLSGTQRRHERAKAFRARLMFAGLMGLLVWGGLLMYLPDSVSGKPTSFLPWVGWLLMFLPSRWAPVSLGGQIVTLAAVGLLIEGLLAQPLWWWVVVACVWILQGAGYLKYKQELSSQVLANGEPQ